MEQYQTALKNWKQNISSSSQVGRIVFTTIKNKILLYFLDCY